MTTYRSSGPTSRYTTSPDYRPEAQLMFLILLMDTFWLWATVHMAGRQRVCHLKSTCLAYWSALQFVRSLRCWPSFCHFRFVFGSSWLHISGPDMVTEPSLAISINTFNQMPLFAWYQSKSRPSISLLPLDPRYVIDKRIQQQGSLNNHKKEKQSHIRPGVAQRVPGRFRLPNFHDIRHMKVFRSSASRTGRFYPQEMFLALIFTRGWVDPRAMERSAGICYWKLQWHHRESIPGPSD